jgi:hypothetical protein
MYAQGVYNIDNMLMVFAQSQDMPPRERFITSKLMMKGFADSVHSAGGKVRWR